MTTKGNTMRCNHESADRPVLLVGVRFILLLALLLPLLLPEHGHAAGGDILWQQGNAVAGKQEALASAVDSAGNVVVTGYVSAGGANDNYYTAKFKADGSGIAWVAAPYDRAGSTDVATAVAIDSAGDVIVTGYSWNGSSNDIHTIKYNGSNGSIIWQHTFNGAAGLGDLGTGVAVDNQNNVYVSGYSAAANGRDDFVLMKFSPSSGDPLWVKTFDHSVNGDDRALSVAAGTGGVAVTGYSWNGTDFDCLTIKYGFDGTKLWERRAGGSYEDRGLWVKLDASGNAVVAGFFSNASDHDIYLAKYAAANGAVSWSSTYTGEADAEPKGLHIDGSGDIFVTGYAWKAAGNFDIYAARFLSGGTNKWEKTFNSNNGDDDLATAITTDAAGNVYVTGYSIVHATANTDFRTLKFSREDGTILWNVPFNGAAGKNEKALGTGVAPDGGIYAIGWSDMWTLGATDFDLYVVKYDPGQLDAPTALAASVVSNTEVSLSWTDNSGNEDGFSIERKIGEGGTFNEIATVGANVTTYNNSGLTASTRYYYRVRAYNAANGNSHYTNEAGVYTLLVTPTAPAWSFTYDDSLMHQDDLATGIVVGPDNHPVVTGTTTSKIEGVGDESFNFLTMKLNRADKSVMWSAWYDNPNTSSDTDPIVAVDRNNDVIVSGSSYQFIDGGEADSQDIFTLKYGSGGGPESWDDWFGYHSNADFAKVVLSTQDGTNKYYVVGYGKNASGNEDIKAMKYNADGSFAWGAPVSYDGGSDDYVRSAVIDPSGNLVITGYRKASGVDRWFTAKFNSANGTIAWSTTFAGVGEGPDQAYSVGTDRTGNVFVAGYVTSGGKKDFYTIKYNAADGTIAWQDAHNGDADGDDFAVALNVDPVDDSVVVAGHVYVSADNNDLHVLRYANDGTMTWDASIVRPATDDKVVAMAMDPSGNFHITGTTGTGLDTDVFSVKYAFDGPLLGMTTYGAAGRNDEPTAIAVNGLGEAFIAGYVNDVYNSVEHKNYVVYKISSSTLQTPSPFTSVANYTRFDLTWTDNSTNEDGYTLERKLGSCTSNNPWGWLATLAANATTHADTLLNQSTTYCYRVRAFKNNGEVSRWAEKPFTTVTPLAPTAFVGTVASTTQINLSWTDNTVGETGFQIERCTGSNCDFSTIDATFTVGENVTTYNDTTTCGGQTYSYRISALKTGEWESAQTVLANKVMTAPANPTGFTATRASEIGVDLAWSDTNADETGYRIERCTGAGCSDFAEIATVVTGVTSYRDTFGIPGTSYSYKVRGYKTATCSWNTGYSSVGSATTSQVDPSGFAGSPINTTQINLAWTDNSGSETGFKIERCAGGGCNDFSTVATTGPNTVTYSDTGVCNGVTYNYRLSARNEGLSNSGGGCWTKRKPLTITNFQGDVQTKVVVSYDSDMKADFSDIRFYDEVAQRELPYWIESKTDSTTATVWLRPTRGTTINLYYGNSSATSSSSGSAVFEMFDDFDSLSAWTTSGGSVSATGGTAILDYGSTPALYRNFTVAPPFSAEVRYQHPSAYRNRLVLTTASGSGSPTGFDYGVFDNGQIYWNGWTGYSLSGSTWYVLRWDNLPIDYAFRVYNTGGTEVFTRNLGSPVAGLARLYFSGTESSSSDLTLDWARVRKYASPEPAGAFGAEEANGCYAFFTWNSGYVTTTAATPASTAPGSASATAISESQINLSWTDGNTDEGGYKIERCAGVGCSDWAEIASLAAGTTSYSNIGLAQSTTYNYRITGYKTVDGCSWSPKYSTATATTMSVPAPSALTVTSPNTTQVNVSWADNTGSETAFVLERCEGSGCSNFSQLVETGPSTVSYVDSSVCKGTQYTYRVRASNQGLSYRNGGCWTRRAPVTITNFQQNFQTKLAITYDAEMKADFSDIRFYDVTDGRELSYWVESKTDGVSATVWLKTGNNNTIYLYYGNSAATSASNGSLTFEFYDGFSGTTIDATKWAFNNGGYYTQADGVLVSSGGPNNWNSSMSSIATFARPFVVEMDHFHTGGQYMMLGVKNNNNGASYSDLVYATYAIYDGNGNRNAVYEDANHRGDYIKTISSGVWQYYKAEVFATGAKYYHGATTASYTNLYTSAYSSASPLKVGFANYNQAFKLDNVRVRKYAATEPAAALGSEESSVCFGFNITWESSYSGTASVTTATPTAPVLTATYGSESLINLSWTNTTTDESAFKVQRCSGAGCNDFADLTTNAPDVVTYADAAVSPMTTYRYRVLASKTASCGWDTDYSAISEATTNVPAPSGLAGTPGNTTTVNLSWTDNSGSETAFKIERCTGGACSDYAEIGSAAADATSYADTTACAAGTYRYRVRAANTGFSNTGGGCWTRRAPLAITNFQANYQTKFVIPYDADMQTDFRDIRFYDTVNQRELPYWIESKTDGVTVTVWVKTRANNSVYLYYGNNLATSSSDPSLTFELWDDFTGTTISAQKWTVVGGNHSQNNELVVNGSTSGWYTGLHSVKNIDRPFIMEVQQYQTNGGEVMLGAKDTGGSSYYGNFPYAIYISGTNNYIYESGSSRGHTSTYSPTNTWNYFKVEVLPTTGARYYLGNSPTNYTKIYENTYYSGSPLKVGFSNNNMTFKWDNLRVRKYAATEPSVAVGAEETSGCFTVGTWASDPTGTVNVTTTSVVIPTLSVALGNEVQLNLSWTDSNGDETGFTLQRCSGSGCSNFTDLATLTPNTITYKDYAVMPKTDYSYRLLAYKTASCAWPTTYSNTVSKNSAVTPPSGLGAVPANTTTINLSWTDNAGAETGYTIARCAGAGCTDFATIDNVLRNVTTYSDTSVCNTTTYRYRVEAKNDGLSAGGGGCWTRRVPVTISNFQPNFQTYITVTYDADMQVDFDDLRFFDATFNRELPYWIESKTDGASAKIYLKTGYNNTIYMYYGNASATSGSSAASTFEFYDDFDGSAIDTTKWNISNSTGFTVSGSALKGTNTSGRIVSKTSYGVGTILEIKAKTTTIATNGQAIGGFYNHGSDNLGWLNHPGNAYYINNGAYTSKSDQTPNKNMLYTMTVKDASTVNLQIYNLDTSATYWNVGDLSHAIGTKPIVLGYRYDDVYGGQAYDTDWDWVRVRKYASPAPSVAFGSEEQDGCFTYAGTWNEAYSAFASATTPSPIPPITLTATAITDTRIDLAWSDNGSADETGFRIERCTNSGCTEFAEIATTLANVTGYQDTTVAPSTTYRYQVRTTKSATCGWNTSYTNTASDLSFPAVATGLTATPLNSLMIRLNWNDNAGDEDGYEVESMAWNGKWNRIATVTAGVTTFTQNFGLDPGKQYSFRVRPYRLTDKSPYTNVATATTPSYTAGDNTCP